MVCLDCPIWVKSACSDVCSEVCNPADVSIALEYCMDFLAPSSIVSGTGVNVSCFFVLLLLSHMSGIFIHSSSVTVFNSCFKSANDCCIFGLTCLYFSS